MLTLLLGLPSLLVPLLLIVVAVTGWIQLGDWIALNVGLSAAAVVSLLYTVHVIKSLMRTGPAEATARGSVLAMLPALSFAVGVAGGVVIASAMEIVVQTWSLVRNGPSVLPLIRLGAAVAALAVLAIRLLKYRRTRARRR